MDWRRGVGRIPQLHTIRQPLHRPVWFPSNHPVTNVLEVEYSIFLMVLYNNMWYIWTSKCGPYYVLFIINIVHLNLPYILYRNNLLCTAHFGITSDARCQGMPGTQSIQN